jgi:hypothetical protein
VAHLLAHDPIRELPIYRDGFHAGRDVGLAIAVAAITAERAHQVRLARHPDPGSHMRVYADSGYLFHGSQGWVWRGSVQAPGPSL